MASAQPQAGQARNSQSECSAADLDSTAGAPAFDDPPGLVRFLLSDHCEPHDWFGDEVIMRWIRRDIPEPLASQPRAIDAGLRLS